MVVKILEAAFQAAVWRNEAGYTWKGGVVIIFEGKIQSWSLLLPNPNLCLRGSIAIDEEGKAWAAVASIKQHEHLRWLRLKERRRISRPSIQNENLSKISAQQRAEYCPSFICA